MAVLEQNQPSPDPTNAASFTLTQADLQAIAAAVEGGAGAGSQDQPVVPLWVFRPQRPTGVGSGRGASFGRLEFGDPSEIPGGRAQAFEEATQAHTKEYAETAWYNLSAEDQDAFAERAQKAGMWEPEDGPYGLFRAWVQAVGNAAAYNGARANDKDKWISPFEALEKLAANNIAGMNGTVNGFTGWRSQRNKQIVKFTEQQIGQTAKDILQRELGRDPTEDEIRAYTVAANQESVRNPHIVNTRTRDTAFDAEGRPIDSETEQTVEGEVFNPTETIEEMAQGSDEYEAYKAASVYLPALQQALGSVV